ncbi:MAG TPA: PDZ domain-containing protein [Xanthomonadaceae bacterium]|jgi:S1-C subfamily serine protease|nr:PDZ domain-containing protein [Xanthomonadaceae bacterium]
MLRKHAWLVMLSLLTAIPCAALAIPPEALVAPAVATGAVATSAVPASAVPASAVGASPAVLPPTSGSRIAAARDAVMPYVVSILTVSQSFSQGEPTLSLSSGSGTVITPQGDIVTNAHVVEKGKAFRVVFADGRELPAKLVGEDTLSDLAVLHAEPAKPEVFKHAEFATTNDLQAGDTVLAMGAPWGLSNSMSAGVVNNPRRLLVSLFDDEADYEDTLGPDLPTGRYYAWIQHDAAIAPGNSGGPLVDMNGRIVGVNARGMVLGGDLAFAIPGPDAKRVVDALIQLHHVPRAYLGFRLRSLKGTDHANGVLLNAVDRDSPAEHAGLRAGDLLLTLDGRSVNAPQPIDVPGLQRDIAELPIGKALALGIERDGKRLDVKLVTAPYPRDATDEIGYAPFGISLRELTAAMARRRGLEFNDGLMLTSLRPGGPAATARPALAAGDVLRTIDGKPVITAHDLKPWLDKPAKIEPLLIGFERDGEDLLTTLRPTYGDRSRTPLPELPQAWAGVEVQPVTSSLAPAFGEAAQGYRISRIYPGSPLGTAGAKVGDIVTAIADQPLKPSSDNSTDQFDQAVRELEVGQPAKFAILHGTAPSVLTIKPTASPLEETGLKVLQVSKLGIQARELSFYDRVERHLPADQKGVYVSTVESGGPGGLAHLRGGDIVLSLDGHATPDLDAFSAALTQALQSHTPAIPILVVRGAEVSLLFLDRSWLQDKLP